MKITNQTFKYNPFAGVDHEEVEQILVPRFDIEAILNTIKSEEALLIELIGKQGRGKTTHLIFLHEQVKEIPIYFLHAGANSFEKILADTSEVIFIDSIHHLNVFQRSQIFKAKRIVIFTTHFTRKYEGLIVGKPTKQLKFKGIDKRILRELVAKRLQFYSIEYDEDLMLNDVEIEKLIKKYGDNYRAIVNHLYDKYQNYE